MFTETTYNAESEFFAFDHYLIELVNQTRSRSEKAAAEKYEEDQVNYY